MNEPRQDRILILAPTGRDATLTAVLLAQELAQQHIECCCCRDREELLLAIEEGAGAALIAEEALVPETVESLLEALERQAPWSDLPLIVFTRGGSRDEALSGL